jgi:hypothetical protein
MVVIRGSQEAQGGTTGSAGNPDPLGDQTAEIFADQLAADRVPSVRAIRAQLHVGQLRAQRLRDYLATDRPDGTKPRRMSHLREGHKPWLSLARSSNKFANRVSEIGQVNA